MVRRGRPWPAAGGRCRPTRCAAVRPGAGTRRARLRRRAGWRASGARGRRRTAREITGQLCRRREVERGLQAFVDDARRAPDRTALQPRFASRGRARLPDRFDQPSNSMRDQAVRRGAASTPVSTPTLPVGAAARGGRSGAGGGGEHGGWRSSRDLIAGSYRYRPRRLLERQAPEIRDGPRRCHVPAVRAGRHQSDDVLVPLLRSAA